MSPLQPLHRRFATSARPAAVWLAFLLSTVAGWTGEARSQGAPPPPKPKPEVSVVVVHPQAVAITAELPGRTAASLVAEVRPQVSGIIKERLFSEGTEVTAGQPLYQIDPASYQASYDSAVASLQKAEAAVPSAQAKVQRRQTLIRTNAVSQQDLDDAIATLAEAKASVAVAKASVETARINLEYTKITAPISGRVGKSTLTPGALVTANQDTALTTIRQLDPINVDVTQSSTILLNLRQAIDEGRIKFSGPQVSVKLTLDNGTTYPHLGKLEFAEANVSETTGTFAVRAQFPNPDRLLLPGMYVRAIVEEGIANNSFLVPQRAVTHNASGQPMALIVSQDNKVEERVLDVARSIGSNWLVRSGIADADKIIVEGSQYVAVGQDVAPLEVTIDEATGELRKPGRGAGPTRPADEQATPTKPVQPNDAQK